MVVYCQLTSEKLAPRDFAFEVPTTVDAPGQTRAFCQPDLNLDMLKQLAPLSVK
jgi:hypothetical protein